MVRDHELVVRARLIRTLDPERPEVECLLVRRGRIEAIGAVEEVRAVVSRGAEWLDLRPATVLPGFSDSHIHLIEWALGLDQPDLAGARSMTEVLARVRESVRKRRADAWLEFKGWDPSSRSQATLAELDRASEGRAVALIAHDLHSGWLNSEAMKRLEIGPAKASPAGGVVERDLEGRPTGVVTERALDWWYQGRPQASDSQRRAALFRGQAELHRLGLTAVHSVEAPDSFRIVEAAEREGELRLRVLHHMPQRFIDPLIECGIASGLGGEWLRVGGIKYFTDGALGSRTAWMLEPYEDAVGCGVRRLEPEEFHHDVQRAAEAGLAATVHAIGDAAVRMTLDVLEAVGNRRLAIPHRIEHLQCTHPDDRARAAHAGIVASMQPSHLLTDIPLVDARWGRERGRGSYAFRSLLSAGTILAFGSDAPVEPPDPREGFYAAILRRTREGNPQKGWFPEERLRSEEVLRAYTEGPARAAGEGSRRGRLSVGFDADFVAWEEDLLTLQPERLLSARVLATVVGGAEVYRA